MGGQEGLQVDVLILVLVDVGLGRLRAFKSDQIERVLILVLVDVGLGLLLAQQLVYMCSS